MLDFSEKQGAISGSSGMARSLEPGRLLGKNMVQVGLRGYATTQQWGVGVKYGVRRILEPEFEKMGAVEAAKQSLEWARDGTEKIYLTVDTDALNPGEAPGTGCRARRHDSTAVDRLRPLPCALYQTRWTLPN